MAVDDVPPPAPSPLGARAYCSLRPVPDGRLQPSRASGNEKRLADDEDAIPGETRKDVPSCHLTRDEARESRFPPLTPARVRALKSIKPCDRSASLRAFYPPRVDDPPSFEPMKNAQLFAKVFLLTTECSFPRGDV